MKQSKTSHPLFRMYTNIRQRTTQPAQLHYSRYGGRGIRMCDEWLTDFWKFVEDVGDKPTPEHQLDRINNDGHYEPGNVRWVTAQENMANRSPRSQVKRFTLAEQTRMRTMRERGCTYLEIGTALNRLPLSVAGWCNRNNVKKNR